MSGATVTAFPHYQLQKRGIQKEQMKVFAHGGVNEHDRNEEDRNTKVSVYVE
ncbi:MAG: hypothetical protein KBT34_14330 [Prevotella sp.]|nr:hypothetical protein [Candidatus Prevotella equi]